MPEANNSFLYKMNNDVFLKKKDGIAEALSIMINLKQ